MFENNKIDAYQIRENILLLEACSVQDSENKAVTQHPGSVLRLSVATTVLRSLCPCLLRYNIALCWIDGFLHMNRSL